MNKREYYREYHRRHRAKRNGQRVARYWLHRQQEIDRNRDYQEWDALPERRPTEDRALSRIMRDEPPRVTE